MTGSRRADALVAAAETLDALAINQSYVIDPLAAIDELGLTLSIARLDNLLGAVVPQGTGGVLITSERSSAIQRYTAAHEIGHWILHEKQLQVDGEADVLGSPSNEMEREAQLFASYFLMPPALFNKAVSAYGMQVNRITPEQVYRLSRDLDVSYEAAARRLRTARFIDDSQLRDILTFGRMRAMQSAFAGHRPADGLADMWDASSDEDVVSLVVEEHDEVVMELPEQRLSGWRWLTGEELAQRNQRSIRIRPRPTSGQPLRRNATQSDGRESEPNRWSARDMQAAVRAGNAPAVGNGVHDVPPAVLVDDSFVADDAETPTQRRRRRTARAAARSDTHEPLIGGTGLRTLIVRTSAPGDWHLQLYYAHSYDPRQQPLLTHELRLNIQPTPNTAFRAQRLASDLNQRLPGDPEDDAVFEVA